MRVADMFVKPIDRDIKGVIKVGQSDEQNVYQELDEYVVTKELAKHFRDFFESYNKSIGGYTDKMGVWISGFFGSGKSHFLKILSYLLENREVKGKKAIDFFIDDHKLDDPMVIANIQRAASVPTDVILFNIDSKSEADAKSNKDAVLDVFVKVFNEKLGFCASLPFLAELERKLVEEGLYDSFKQKFAGIEGREWDDARDDFYFIQDEVVEALSSIDFMSKEAARNWCEKAESSYTMTPEKFADLVREYCESRGNDQHVVFLADEMGQYIADDTRMMLNLQTIVEDLGTACGGKVWVVVTSQQDIDALTNVKGNDFSKIQGRFDTRLALSSSNVDEVIRKRILAKNQTALDTLRLLYDQKEAVIKNILTFTDEIEKKLFSGRDEFAEVYPFIPYQFNLLGNVLTAIRTHGASGKHLAEGERSMLALFKESTMRFMNEQEGVLIPFNVFYDALDNFIDHTHRIVIKQAEDNSRLEPFDVELLKVLFMIKYVKEIKANVENLTTLMVSHIDEDRITLKKQVEGSLARLVSQTLVQKNGDTYMFLTNEEQEINRAIQNEVVDPGEVIKEVWNIVFGDIIKDVKYRYSARYNFPYNQMVDGVYFKTDPSAEISVNIITPYNEISDNDAALRMLSVRESCVIVALPRDASFLEEISDMRKIEKFLMHQGNSLSGSFESIKRAKGDERLEKRQRVRIFIEEAVKNADIYVKGDKINTASKDAANRINEALGKLVNSVYNKLSYMETEPDDSDIRSILKLPDGQIMMNINSGSIRNKQALDDVLRAVELNAMHHMKTPMKSIMDTFSKAPYGFVDKDIQYLVAVLFRQGKIALILNGKNISLLDTDADEILKYIIRREYMDKLLIEKRVRASAAQIKSAKEVMKELFSMPIVSDEDDAIIKTFKERAKNKMAEIDKYLVEYRVDDRLPGKNILEKAKRLLETTIDIDNPAEFFNYVDEHKDDLFDIAESIAPIFSFFNGEQRKIFDKALNHMNIYDKSKNYVTDRAIMDIAEKIRRIVVMAEPYSQIFKLPDLIKRFDELYLGILEKEAEPIHSIIEEDRKYVLSKLNEPDLADEFKNKFTDAFAELAAKLERANDIASVRNIGYESEALKKRCLDEIAQYRKHLNDLYKKKNDGPAKVADPPAPPVAKEMKTISIEDIVARNITIENKDDLERFISSLKNKLLQELSDGVVINLLI